MVHAAVVLQKQCACMPVVAKLALLQCSWHCNPCGGPGLASRPGRKNALWSGSRWSHSRVLSAIHTLQTNLLAKSTLARGATLLCMHASACLSSFMHQSVSDHVQTFRQHCRRKARPHAISRGAGLERGSVYCSGSSIQLTPCCCRAHCTACMSLHRHCNTRACNPRRAATPPW